MRIAAAQTHRAVIPDTAMALTIVTLGQAVSPAQPHLRAAIVTFCVGNSGVAMRAALAGRSHRFMAVIAPPSKIAAIPKSDG